MPNILCFLFNFYPPFVFGKTGDHRNEIREDGLIYRALRGYYVFSVARPRCLLQRFESPQRPQRAAIGTMANISQSLHALLERAQKQDSLGKLIIEALVLIESVIDILGCVFSLCNLDRLLMADGCREETVAISFNGGKDCMSTCKLLAAIAFSRLIVGNSFQVRYCCISMLLSCMPDIPLPSHLIYFPSLLQR